jgi:DNA-directed RNA polymerase beta' subunit
MSGIISDLFKGVLPSTVRPALTNNDIVIKISEEEFREMALKGVDERFKTNMSIKLKEGCIEITVRLM